MTPISGVSANRSSVIGPHPATAIVKLNFSFPLRDRSALQKLIAQHTVLSRDELYSRFSPSVGQYGALRGWLLSQGLKITHVGADRLQMTAQGTQSYTYENYSKQYSGLRFEQQTDPLPMTFRTPTSLARLTAWAVAILIKLTHAISRIKAAISQRLLIRAVDIFFPL